MYVVSLLQPSESDYAACQIIIITLSNFLLYQVANEEFEIQENSKYLAQVYILISLATFSVCKIKESEFQKNSVFLYPIVMHSLLHFHSYTIFAYCTSVFFKRFRCAAQTSEQGGEQKAYPSNKIKSHTPNPTERITPIFQQAMCSQSIHICCQKPFLCDNK